MEINLYLSLASDIIAIISQGEVESVETIKKEITDGNIVNYLINKYSLQYTQMQNSQDIISLNNNISNYQDLVYENIEDVLGISSRCKNGLILFESLLIEIISQNMR